MAIEHLYITLRFLYHACKSVHFLVKSIFRKSNFQFLPRIKKIDKNFHFNFILELWLVFLLNRSLYQIFRSWKSNFGHKNQKSFNEMNNSTRSMFILYASYKFWVKSNVPTVFFTARQQSVLKTYSRLSWLSQTSF